MDSNEKKDLSTKDFVALLVFAGMVIAILAGFFSFEDFLKAHTGTYYIQCEQCGNVIMCKDGEVTQLGVQRWIEYQSNNSNSCNQGSCTDTASETCPAQENCGNACVSSQANNTCNRQCSCHYCTSGACQAEQKSETKERGTDNGFGN